MENFYVYILTNHSRTLYTGVTNNLSARLWQHQNKLLDGFTKKYNVSKLVYYEIFPTILEARSREYQIKGYRREKKIALIEKENPRWEDLSIQVARS
jgi:putative endonuclease